MLQRAASNAYSWWWASHIRTKQSKWLEQSLQDMGEKVQSVMKLIQEDGDTFAKRAEMYYKKRPELISFVEESFRAYQALAERYDHLSKELQKANSTLASAFPDQFQCPMDDDYDDAPPRGFKRFQEKHNPNVPQAPSKFPAKNLKVIMALTANKNNNNDPIKKAQKEAANVRKSGLTKAEAVNEVDKLQKQILILQTEKEFAKSSYEKGYSKYWDIEEQIPTLQERISKLQDEFQITQAIKDGEARTLMAETALKSCQQTLAYLRERQAQAVAEAKVQRLRIREAREKLKSLRGEVLGSQGDQIEESERGDSREAGEKMMRFDDEVDNSMVSKDFEKLRDKIKEHFDVGPTGSLTVTEMAEKVDELVNKVISLESSVSSQNAIIHRLRSDTNELHSQINTHENDKSTLIDEKNTLNYQLASMERKLKGLLDLNREFEKENSSLETHFTEARSNLDTMSEKLHDVKPDEEILYTSTVKEKKKKKDKKERKENKDKKKSDKHKPCASTPEIEPSEHKSSETTPMMKSDELKSTTSTRSMKESDELQSSTSLPSKKESDELQSSATTRMKESDELQSSATTPMKESDEIQSSATTPMKESDEIQSSATIPSKKESVELQSSTSTRSAKDDTQVKKQPRDDEPKPTVSVSDVAQSLATSNKQEVDPVKPQEPASVSKDDEHKRTRPDVAQSRETSNEQEGELVQPRKSESVSKDDECKLTGPDIAQSHATSNKQEVELVQPQESASVPKNERTLEREAKAKGTVSKPTDDAKVAHQVHTSKQEVERVQVQESASVRKDERTLEREAKAKGTTSKPTDDSNVPPQVHTSKQEVENVQVHQSASVPKDKRTLEREATSKGTAIKPTDDANVAPQVHTSKQEDETDWRQLFMNTKEEYTCTLRNYKVANKKLGEMEQKTQDDISEIMKQLKELKNSNAKKDEELHNLRQRILALQKRLEDFKNLKDAKDAEPEVKNEEPTSPTEDDYDIKVIPAYDGDQISPLEEKLRADIDEILEENLDFWMRFSSSFAQIQKFQDAIKDLHRELKKLERHDESGHGGNSDGSLHIDPDMKSEARPIYRHLREIRTELTVWIEQSEKFKDELQSRFSQLCNIEHEIKRAVDAGAEDDDMKFTSYQAAKFQGEVANMQQENHKVAEELQAGMDHITSLQLEVERTVTRLDDELGFSGTQNYQDDSQSRASNPNRVPLRSFIFGVKPQKKKQSIFSCIHPAMINKRYQNLKIN